MPRPVPPAPLLLPRPPASVVAVASALRGTVLVLGAGGKLGLPLTLTLAKAARHARAEVHIIAVSRGRGLLEQPNVRMPRLVAERFRGARTVALSTACVYPFVPVHSRGASETPVAPEGSSDLGQTDGLREA